MTSQQSLARNALSIATLAFSVNFAIWTLYAVMGIEIRQQLNLSATDFGLLLAAPMLTGALLRFPAGYLVEKFNAKSVFIWQMLLLIPPLLLLCYAESYLDYVVIGLFLGISGTSFTIGIQYVSTWYTKTHQGTAMGIFGAGNVGAAFTLLVTPLIIEHFSWQAIGPIFSLLILITCALFALLAPKRNQAQPHKSTPFKALISDFRVWRFSLYYYFVFGSFLALILWLPQYYMSAYQLTPTEAMSHTLIFVFISSSVRALGGLISDKYAATQVNWGVFWVCLVCLFFLSYPPTTMTIHGIKGDVNVSIGINVWLFTALLIVIGIAQGIGRASVFKVIHGYYPNQMGSVGGFVAAIGALGGFTLPVLFGFAEEVIGVHSASFMLLYSILALCMVLLHLALKSEKHQQRLAAALADDFLEQD